MTRTETPAPDLALAKQRPRQMWPSGDFHAVATLLFADLVALVGRHTAAGDAPVAIPTAWLETVAVRSGA
jgi:hypothetical protein